GIVLKQPIFAGGRLDAARKAARHLRDSRLFDKETVEKEVLFQVTRIYRTAQVAEAFNRVAVEAVDLLNQHEHDVNILVREGALPEVDLLRTQTELANAVKDLNVTSNAFDIAMSSLKNLLVIDLETPVVLTQILRRIEYTGESLENLTIEAIKNRSELSALKMRVEAGKQGLRAAKGKYLPSIAFEAHYDYMKGDIRELDGDDHWTIGVGAEVPLWNWGETRAGVIKSASFLKQVKIEYKKTEEAICLQVRKAFLNLGKSQKNITAAESALKTSKEGFRLERARYQAGEGINTDVLDARTALSRAEANHLQALFEYNIALADIERAVGIKSITEKNREQAQ
nr:TolC family protein [Desulfobacterales bacterium]